MRTSPLPTIALIALLVVAGCTGMPGAGEPTTKAPPDVSLDNFPDASGINASVFETHANEMGNTSFTFISQLNRTDRNAEFMDSNFTHYNLTSRGLFDPDDSQYLRHTRGYLGNSSTYWNGSVEYIHFREDNSTERRAITPTSPRNESGENYLWDGLFVKDRSPPETFGAINATYERKDAEWFHGTAVMRYETTGVDALPDRWTANESEPQRYKNFSATLLIDDDGIIHHYRYTFKKVEKQHSYTNALYKRSYTITDIGTTDVEKPDWVTEFRENE